MSIASPRESSSSHKYYGNMHTYYDFNSMNMAKACDFPADRLDSLSELTVSLSRSSNYSIVLSRSYPLQFKGCILKRNLKTESIFNQQVASGYHLGNQYQILSLYFPTGVLPKLHHFALHCCCIKISKRFMYRKTSPIRKKEILHGSQTWKRRPHKVVT